MVFKSNYLDCVTAAVASGSMLLILALAVLVSTNAFKISSSKWACASSLAVALISTLEPALANDLGASKITSKVQLDVSINRQPPMTLQIGIYGNAAPESSQRFLSFCSGDNSYRSSEGAFNYDGAQVSKIIKGSEIEFGKFKAGRGKKLSTSMSQSGQVSLSSIDLSDEITPTTDRLGLLPHMKGTVSVPAKGRSFEFDISARDGNTDLDKTNVVIGQVLVNYSDKDRGGGLAAVEAIDKVPVSRDDLLQSKSVIASAGKAFDPRAKLARVNRPLERVEVVACRVEESASMASFLKF
jgi:cyclophilin family peptidyl-prolyl cis-trans isomerase